MSHQWNNTWSYLSDEVPGRHCQIYVKITAITWWPHVITVWWLMYSYCHVVIVTWLQSEDWRTVIVTWSSSRDYNSGDWCTGREKVHCNDSTLYPERELSVTWNRDMEKNYVVTVDTLKTGYVVTRLYCTITWWPSVTVTWWPSGDWRTVIVTWWSSRDFTALWTRTIALLTFCPVSTVLSCKYRFVL